jgi:BASS family bile acid:Na+ symporter
MDPLQWLVKGTVVVFVVSSMLSIGLAARSAEIIAPIRHPVWVLRALIANFVLAPLLAWSMAYVVPLDPGYELGLLLLGFAAGSPLLPKLAEAGRTNVASATALMVLLMVGTVVIMPLALPLFAKGMQVDPWRIAAPLVILMLAPLLLGLAGQRFWPRTGHDELLLVANVS